MSLYTEAWGRVSAKASGARRSRRRFAGTLEPIHGLRVRLEDRGRELCFLHEATIELPRLEIARDLSRLEAAAALLRWLRLGTPQACPDPGVWQVAQDCLTRLDAPQGPPPPRVLAETGLSLLVALGWALTLDACVGCARVCRPNQPSRLDPRRGGLLCRQCGFGSIELAADVRTRLQVAAQGGSGILQAEDTELALRLVRETLATHAGVEPA